MLRTLFSATILAGALAGSAMAQAPHPTKNGDLLPTSITGRSNKKVWWQCPEGHTSYQSISSRTDGVGCPNCYRLKRGEIVRQGKLRRSGSLAEKRPDVAVRQHRRSGDGCVKIKRQMSSIRQVASSTGLSFCDPMQCFSLVF